MTTLGAATKRTVLIMPSGGCASRVATPLRRHDDRAPPDNPSHRATSRTECAPAAALTPRPRCACLAASASRSTQACNARALALAPHDPRRLHQQAAHRSGPGFRDRALPLPRAGAVFARHQPEIGRRTPPASAKRAHVQRGAIRQRHDRPDARRRHQPPRDRIRRRRAPARLGRRCRDQRRQAGRAPSSSGASARRSAAGSASAVEPRAPPFRPSPSGSRSPSCRSCARNRLIACVRMRTSCSRTRTPAGAARRCAADTRCAAPIDAQATRLGQRRHIPSIRLDPPRPRAHTSARNSDPPRSPRARRPRESAPPTRSPCPLSTSTRSGGRPANTSVNASARRRDRALHDAPPRPRPRSESGCPSRADRWHHIPWLAAPLRLERVIPLWSARYHSKDSQPLHLIFVIRFSVVDSRFLLQPHKSRSHRSRYGTLPTMIAKSIERPGRNEPCHCGSGKSTSSAVSTRTRRRQVPQGPRLRPKPRRQMRRPRTRAPSRSGRPRRRRISRGERRPIAATSRARVRPAKWVEARTTPTAPARAPAYTACHPPDSAASPSAPLSGRSRSASQRTEGLRSGAGWASCLPEPRRTSLPGRTSHPASAG